MSRHRVLAVGMAAACTLLACVASAAVFEQGEVSYRKGWVADAEATLNPLLQKTHHQDYPRYLLALGSVELSLGDYRRAGEVLGAAVQNLTAELGGVATATALLEAESKRPYRGYPHEKVLAHSYLGLAYFQQGQHNDARIEFAKAREEHRGQGAGQEADFVTVEFLDGINAMRAAKFNDAQVSFRKVTELKKDWPIGWYALCRASDLNHDLTEADETWVKYESMTAPESRLARDGSTPCAIFLIDAGWGPTRKPDAILGEFGQWSPTPSAEKGVRLAIPGQARVDATAVDDLAFQASTSGGFRGEATRKITSAVTKSLARQVPGLGLFVPKSEADVRTWSISPGTIHLAALPMPTSPSTVELTCADKSGKSVDADRQVFHYIGGRPFDQAAIIYARVLPNGDARATFHDRKRGHR